MGSQPSSWTRTSAGVFWTSAGTEMTRARSMVIAGTTTIGRRGPEVARVVAVTLAGTWGGEVVEVEVAAEADAGNLSPFEEEVAEVDARR